MRCLSPIWTLALDGTTDPTWILENMALGSWELRSIWGGTALSYATLLSGMFSGDLGDPFPMENIAAVFERNTGKPLVEACRGAQWYP